MRRAFISHDHRSTHGSSKEYRARRAALRKKLCFLVLLATTAMPEVARSETFDCLIEPRLKLELAAPAAGVLKEVLVDRGDRVQRGDVVARLDSTVEEATVALDKARAASEAAVASRSARVEFLTVKRDRVRQLQTRGTIAQAELDEAEAELAVATADLADAQDQRRTARLEYDRSVAILNQRSIRSPIDGVVVERRLAGGEYTYDQAPILVLAEIDPLNVEVYLPISAFPKIRRGMIAFVRPAEPIGDNYRAAVETVDMVFDARSDTFGIRLNLPNPDYRIPAGLRCEVEFAAR
jgi:RND family efflux transporter MFP subunit